MNATRLLRAVVPVAATLGLVLSRAVVWCAAATAPGPIVTNGGFEDSPLDDPIHIAGESFGGWTVGVGYAGVTYEPGTAYAGLLSLGMVSGSSVYQDIPTVPGMVYEVSFWQCFHGGATAPIYMVWWDDQVAFGDASRNAWGPALHTFTATRATTRLSLGSASTDISYDEVSVVPVFPRLNISRTPDSRLEITWETNHVGYALESIGSLPVAAWVPVTNSIAISGDRFAVVLSAGELQRYFRLHKP